MWDHTTDSAKDDAGRRTVVEWPHLGSCWYVFSWILPTSLVLTALPLTTTCSQRTTTTVWPPKAVWQQLKPCGQAYGHARQQQLLLKYHDSRVLINLVQKKRKGYVLYVYFLSRKIVTRLIVPGAGRGGWPGTINCSRQCNATPLKKIHRCDLFLRWGDKEVMRKGESVPKWILVA